MRKLHAIAFAVSLSIASAPFARATEQMLSGPVLAVTGATSATPIVVTTATHSYVTGDIVRVSSVLGNTCANGMWIVTFVSTTTFSLQGSVGAGCAAYTSSGTSQLLGARANGSSAWFDTATAENVRIHVYGSAAVTGVVTIEGSASAFSPSQTPVNNPAVTLGSVVTNPTTAGIYQTVAGGRVRVTVSAWTVGTVYATIESYGPTGIRRIY